MFALAGVGPDRVDALTPRGAVVGAETAFVDVVARGPVALEARVAHALGIVAGEAGGVGMAAMLPCAAEVQGLAGG